MWTMNRLKQRDNWTRQRVHTHTYNYRPVEDTFKRHVQEFKTGRKTHADMATAMGNKRLHQAYVLENQEKELSGSAPQKERHEESRHTKWVREGENEETWVNKPKDRALFRMTAGLSKMAPGKSSGNPAFGVVLMLLMIIFFLLITMVPVWPGDNPSKTRFQLATGVFGGKYSLPDVAPTASTPSAKTPSPTTKAPSGGRAAALDPAIYAK